MTPMQRSLALLRKEGWTCGITEHWNPHAKRRFDLFGFIDIEAIRDDETLAVQTTTGANVAARVAKIKALPEAAMWLAAGNRIEVHGWRKVGPRGKQKKWDVRRVEVKR